MEPLPVLIRHVFGYFVKNGPQVCLRIIFLIPITYTSVCKSKYTSKKELFTGTKRGFIYVAYIGSAMPFLNHTYFKRSYKIVAFKEHFLCFVNGLKIQGIGDESLLALNWNWMHCSTLFKNRLRIHSTL